MYKRILVPLDGSKLAELALPYAEELARAFNSEVTLVYVCEPAESQYRHMPQLYLEKIAELVKKEGITAKVNSVVLLGEAAEEIVNYAERSNISLTVMATHGRSGIMSWAMGSIANKVTQRINTPLLLIKAKLPYPEVGVGEVFNKILIPLDGSDVGEAALPYVKELTEKIKAEVILLQVIAPGQHVHTIGGLDYVRFTNQQMKSMAAEAEQYLAKISRELMGTKATVRCEVKVGDAAQEVVKLAEETDSHLVALSSHGRSGIKQWIFGNVAHKILQASSKSVLLVRRR